MHNNRITIADVLRSHGSLKIKFIKLTDCLFGSLIASLVPKQTEKTLKKEDIRNILIIRPGGLGDAIFLIPIIKAIRQTHSEILIDILCEKRNQEIFASQKNLNLGVFSYDNFAQFSKVRKNSYDVIFDTEQWHYLSALIANTIPHQYTIGFATRPMRKKLFNMPIAYEIDQYELENFKQLFMTIFPEVANLLDINNSLSIDPAYSRWAKETVPGESVSIFLGASIFIRRLSHEQLLPIIKIILKKGMNAILLGGKDAREEGEKLTQEIHDKHLIDFTGKISLQESAALIKQSQLFVGPDSGLMHLACAVGTPVIGIFGPGNLKKWIPRGEAHIVVTENVACSPCTQFGYTVPTCHGSYHCMRNINISQLKQIIEKRYSFN